MPVKPSRLVKDQKEFIAEELRSQFRTKHPRVEAHFYNYQRMDRPLGDPEGLPVKLRVTKDMYRKVVAELSASRKELAHNHRKAVRAEYLLQMAIKALTSKEDNAELGKQVINLYMEELQNDWKLMMGEWTGATWLDTNFVPKPGQTLKTRSIK